MSREFGQYNNGYFHDNIRRAIEDLKEESREEFHKEFIPLFEELYEIAWAISSVEAGDSGLYRSINETIERLPAVKKSLAKLEDYLEPYSEVAREAVRQALSKKG